jgi:beta-N-acetylhexosaminidase
MSCSNTSVLETWSNERLAAMTIAVPVQETSSSDVAPEVRQGVGGVVLFGTSAPVDLGRQLAALRNQVPGRLGLLVMTDEEGGGVQRMANLVGSLPWPRQMATDWTRYHLRRAVYRMGLKMKAAGVNMDLAPVVDVDGSNQVFPNRYNADGWRSFGGDPIAVAKDGIDFAKALMKAHVVPVLKHFPGLGGASYNTDDGPAHTLPWTQERQRGLPPFSMGIAAGIPAIMTSNATVPNLASYPVSLSPAATGRELETTLGFHGFVVTDSLSALAIADSGWSIPSAAVQALVAGADMVMFSSTPGTTVQGETDAITSAVVTAVARGTLPRSRLVAAAGAVLHVHHKSLCG